MKHFQILKTVCRWNVPNHFAHNNSRLCDFKHTCGYSDGIFGIGTVAAAFTMGKGIVLMGKLLDKKFAFVSVLSPERP